MIGSPFFIFAINVLMVTFFLAGASAITNPPSHQAVSNALKNPAAIYAAQPFFVCRCMERYGIRSVKYPKTIVYVPLAMMGAIADQGGRRIAAWARAAAMPSRNPTAPRVCADNPYKLENYAVP
ncbi:hypothetical protein [Bradyrhizobium sp. Ash2021]|uniref:hypothetical protein n=1 Tax=Bradyrhizobium sp. Ash2021 TaxID=2954771 RepID=UPI00281561CA|nr:hypothetical protein [Bradyrhizobium sp. Ash2021]WMT72081.1 hypothetical protein NL528_28995 [Bradyrhizobium sp. Ash2021]